MDLEQLKRIKELMKEAKLPGETDDQFIERITKKSQVPQKPLPKRPRSEEKEMPIYEYAD